MASLLKGSEKKNSSKLLLILLGRMEGFLNFEILNMKNIYLDKNEVKVSYKGWSVSTKGQNAKLLKGAFAIVAVCAGIAILLK